MAHSSFASKAQFPCGDELVKAHGEVPSAIYQRGAEVVVPVDVATLTSGREAGRSGDWPERDWRIHRRDVLYRGGDYVAVCSCGFISTSRSTFYAAFVTECEVEALLAVSSERRRRLYLEG